MATHHFADVAQQRQVFAHGGSFVNCRAHCPTRVRVSPSAPLSEVRSEKDEVRALWSKLLLRTSHLTLRPSLCVRGEIIIILRFERRVCRWESCRMHQFMGMWLNPNSRGSRLRIWQPWGCNSLHAHHLTATGFSGNSRPRRLKIAEPSGCKSRVADRRVVNREQQTGSTQDRTALGVLCFSRSERRLWGN